MCILLLLQPKQITANFMTLIQLQLVLILRKTQDSTDFLPMKEGTVFLFSYLFFFLKIPNPRINWVLADIAFYLQQSFLGHEDVFFLFVLNSHPFYTRNSQIFRLRKRVGVYYLHLPEIFYFKSVLRAEKLSLQSSPDSGPADWQPK